MNHQAEAGTQHQVGDARACPSEALAELEHGTLFAGGAPLNVQFRLHLAEPRRLHIVRRALMFLAITWLPLVVFAALAGDASLRSLLSSLGLLSRYFVAGPLLLAGEATAIFVLGMVARRFLAMHFVVTADHPRFAAAVASTLRWRDAPAAEVAAALVALAIGVLTSQLVPIAELPQWYRSEVDGRRSLAGWWHALVSLPLLWVLVLGAFWRLVLWTRFLWLVSRLDLALVPVHPDRSAGLGFVGHSVIGFCLVGSAFGAILAGAVAEQVIHGGEAPAQFKYLIAGLVVLTVVLFTAPLFALTPKLLQARRRGMWQYNELANVLGRRFERDWFGGKPLDRDDLLERSDFSAATDLYQVIDRVRDLRLVAVDLKSVAMLVGATLLPFVPVLVAALPLDAVLKELVTLLL